MAFPFIKAMGIIVKLKENYSFRRAYKKGKSLVCPYFVIYAVKTRRGVRLGITAGKKLGCAVKRNRAKRVIVAAFRQLLPCISGGYDFVFVARVRTAAAQSTEVFKYLKKAFLKEGIIAENETITDKDN